MTTKVQGSQGIEFPDSTQQATAAAVTIPATGGRKCTKFSDGTLIWAVSSLTMGTVAPQAIGNNVFSFAELPFVGTYSVTCSPNTSAPPFGACSALKESQSQARIYAFNSNTSASAEIFVDAIAIGRWKA